MRKATGAGLSGSDRRRWPRRRWPSQGAARDQSQGRRSISLLWVDIWFTSVFFLRLVNISQILGMVINPLRRFINVSGGIGKQEEEEDTTW